MSPETKKALDSLIKTHAVNLLKQEIISDDIAEDMLGYIIADVLARLTTSGMEALELSIRINSALVLMAARIEMENTSNSNSSFSE